MNAQLSNVIKSFSEKNISEERKKILSPLIEFIKIKILSGDSIRLNFICTHNSRRSHLCQVWAQTFASYFGIK